MDSKCIDVRVRFTQGSSLLFPHVLIPACSTWQERKVACTESVLAFSHIEREKLLDVVPLNEIIGIQDMGGIGNADLDDDAGRIKLELILTDRSSDNFFSKFITHQSSTLADEKEKCRKVFDSIDTDKTGSCSIEELTIFLKKMFYTPEEIEKFIKCADADRSGEMSFEEFWELQYKFGQGRRYRDVKVKVVQAENILNAGSITKKKM